MASMQFSSSLATWLTHLQRLMPPTLVMLVGAGDRNGRWVQWLDHERVVDAILIEADHSLVSSLQGLQTIHPSWRVRKAVVAGRAEAVTFHVASVINESGLVEPEALRDLWPNIKTLHKETVQSIALSNVLREEPKANWLFIDCLPASELVASARSELEAVDVLLTRVALDSAENGGTASEMGPLELELKALGFRLATVEAGRHPKLGHALWARDYHRLALEKQQLNTALACRVQELDISLVATQTQAEQLATEKQRLESQLRDAEDRTRAWPEQIEALSGCVTALQLTQQGDQQLLKGLMQELIEARQALSAIHSHGQEGQKQLTQLLNESKALLRQDLTKGLANAVKQIEAFVSVQNYLNTGESISNFHGWPISPDIALFLLEKMHERRHDFVIEFGSGTSTILFAKALSMRSQAGRATVPAGPEATHPRVLAIEHDPKYFHQTASSITAHGVDGWVDLVLAPLKPWHDGTNEYLHYECEAALARIDASAEGRQLSILVLVDGPPGVTCKNARYPAVPKVFERLAQHKIDLVLDDAGREEELSVIELWRLFWKQKGIPIEEVFVSSEKGLYFARNY